MVRIALAVPMLALSVCAAGQPAATIALTSRPSPLGLGQNFFEATVQDVNGQGVTDAEVTLLLVMPADPRTKHPEMRTEGKLNNAGGGKYNGIAMVTMAGDWDVTVTARRSGKTVAEKQWRMTAHLTRPATNK